MNELGSTAHLVAVSTCYVAGSRRGAAPEELIDESPFFVDVDWRQEVDAARRARLDAETSSRTPDRLAKFRKGARHDLVPPARHCSQRRRSVAVRVGDGHMVAAGRARASSSASPMPRVSRKPSASAR